MNQLSAAQSSMFGDVAPVQKLYDLIDRYEQFNVYVDDAHGMSWAGENGRGYFLSQVSYFHDKLCLITSFCKGFGTNGATMVFANEAQKSMIKYIGSTLIFQVLLLLHLWQRVLLRQIYI